jgi:hypothetical protein
MHYPKNAAAIDDNIPTIIPLIGNPTLGQLEKLSSVSIIGEKKNRFEKLYQLQNVHVFLA